jgi:hypothetical protein
VSVVAARLYRSGKNVKAVSLDEPIDCKGKSEFVWIGLFEPTDQSLSNLRRIMGFILFRLRTHSKQTKCRRLMFMATNYL